MTYIKHTLIVAMIAFLMASCASQSAPQKLDSFVDKAELNSSSYSQTDWEKSAVEYQKLVDDYMYSGKEYTEAEKEMAARAMGRYHALLLKNGIEKGASFLKEFGKMLPEYLDGLASGLDENADGVGSALENLFDEEKMEKSLDALGSALEKLFGGDSE